MGQRVNLVDATATTMTRTARARSAVVRIGTVASAPANNLVDVTIGATPVGNVVDNTLTAGKARASYPADAWPIVGDQVILVKDRDMWVIVGAIAGVRPDNKQYGRPIHHVAWTSNSQTLTATHTFYPMGAEQGLASHLSGGYVAVDVPGTYVCTSFLQGATKDAAGAQAFMQIYLNHYNAGGGLLEQDGHTIRGNGGYAVNCATYCIWQLSVGEKLGVTIAAGGSLGAGPFTNLGYIRIHRLGPLIT